MNCLIRHWPALGLQEMIEDLPLRILKEIGERRLLASTAHACH